MSYYRHHLFFCTNQRADGGRCCADNGAKALRDYAKQRIKAMGLRGVGGARANTAGCLNRCASGPVLVIYPEGVWYTYASKEDIDEILEKHVGLGEPVTRLQLAS
ncbi:MAG: (2Fe-2S) ferredoxin domain-containing protein [Gammaproteobacteria bacterium]|nr:(2Fe-2S) ferredoxin domain-containing protein [Gammaproteobacteria bacterium]